MASVNALVLASQSPFRRALLASTGAFFETLTAPIDEHAVQDPDARTLARRRGEAKALAVAALRPRALVIGADQVLGVGGEPLDKVASTEAARERLAALAGRTHVLHSGLVLAYQEAPGAEPRLLASTVLDVAMPMRPLTPDEITAYVATGEWEGSVGCYQFENRGVHLFESVAADQATIVGLPLQRLLALLRGLGVDLLRAPAPPWRLSL